MESFRFDRLTAGTIFKIGFFALLGFFLPLFALAGVFAMLGSDVVQVNGRYVHGVSGLVAAIVMAFLFPVILAGAMTLGGLLARLFSGMLPALTLRGGAPR